MSNFTIVLAGLISKEKLEFLLQSFSGQPIDEVVVPLRVEMFDQAGFSDKFETLTEYAALNVVPLIISNAQSNASLLNQAIAASSNENVCLMERPVLLSDVDLDLLSEELIANPRAIAQFERRVLSTPRDSNATDLYFGAFPKEDTVKVSAFAIRRRYFLELRGFDESTGFSELLGADLIARHIRRGGEFIHFPDRGGVVYSLLGQSLFDEFEELDVESAIKQIESDQSIYRNLIEWSVPTNLRVPLVSVAIATKDRAQLLGESISSVLYQSFQDFEIVIVDDGSSDHEAVQAVVHGFKDARIKFLRNGESHGVSYARNRAADATDCLLTAVHDDDDLMLPHRLQSGIEVLSASVDASYGAWTNFDDHDGSMRTFLTQHGFGADLVAFNGAGPGHSTWTLPTAIIKQLRYNEDLTSAVDHYLATRSAAAGVRWSHVGKVMYLRRVHDLQITAQDGARQKAGHMLSMIGNRFLASSSGLNEMKEKGKSLKYPVAEGARTPETHFAAYLPDHLVTRDVVIENNVANTLMAADFPSQMVSVLEDRDIETGRLFTEQALLRDMSLTDLVKLRANGVVKWRAVGRLKSDGLTELENSIEDVEKSSTRETTDKVRGQALDRLDLVLGALRKRHKNGYLLLLWNEDHAESLRDEFGLAEAVLKRRVLVKGEFGTTASFRAFGFSNFSSALYAEKQIKEISPSITPLIFPSIDPKDLMAELLEIQQRKAIIDSLDDSGLGI